RRAPSRIDWRAFIDSLISRASRSFSGSGVPFGPSRSTESPRSLTRIASLMPLDVLPVAASLSKKILAGSGVVIVAGLACVAYGIFVERRWYRRARYRLPVLPDGTAPVSILHLSDLHLRAGDRRLPSFLGALERPDVLI